MVSLTPQQFKEETAVAAFKEGCINGALSFIPCYGAVWLALKKSPKFVKITNWQSRTAIVIMPPLFVFAFTAERTLDHKMREMAIRNEHIRETAAWAERKQAEQNPNYSMMSSHGNMDKIRDMETQPQILDLYRQSVAQSGVRIVPELTLFHHAANYWQDHPFRILAGMTIPALGYIFYGRSGQEHLQFQMKVMHTRVFGQFTVIAMLVTLMGFKGYMDQNGRFITEAEAEQRVTEMAEVRRDLLMRLELEKQHQADIDAAIREAHDRDVQSGNVHEKKKKKKHNNHDNIKGIESM